MSGPIHTDGAILSYGVTVENGHPVAYIALKESAVCAGCSRAVYLVVNRAGSTLCVECDAKRKDRQ